MLMARARKYDAIYTKPMSHTRPMKPDEPGVSLETDETDISFEVMKSNYVKTCLVEGT